ncbi:hypothetical protein [Paracoccus sp. (in: a-proteobacteria)]|uniref:hypothetical protein n=1 Tax=Paracoccus sp. TaxID=267 RepID=UPI0026E066F1|nr:hypothetical protein [Paracoccus sp. (in: a-proteobacteria)]MDO5647330.1 hypothetical protein [Paracoccus sp. (in: a-proteobacteria)]
MDNQIHVTHQNWAVGMGGMRLCVAASQADEAARLLRDLPPSRRPRRSWYYWVILTLRVWWGGMGAAPVPVPSGIVLRRD